MSSPSPQGDKWRVKTVYLMSAAVALGTALHFGLPYWSAPGASLADFAAQAHANGPAATLAADVTVLYLLVNVWIVHEGRRMGIKRLWLFVLANTFVAVAFGLSLFLWSRARGEGRDAARAR